MSVQFKFFSLPIPCEEELAKNQMRQNRKYSLDISPGTEEEIGWEQRGIDGNFHPGDEVEIVVDSWSWKMRVNFNSKGISETNWFK
jgi:hypothetical protein